MSKISKYFLKIHPGNLGRPQITRLGRSANSPKTLETARTKCPRGCTGTKSKASSKCHWPYCSSVYLFLSPSPFDFVWESVRILCPFRGCTLHVLNWLFCVVYHLQCNASSLIDLFRPKTDSERTLFRPTYPLAPILATLCNANAEYTPLDTGSFRWIGKKMSALCSFCLGQHIKNINSVKA